ncbi:MAG: hypothetical protein ABEH58_07345, partial [Haloplanus sp.]
MPDEAVARDDDGQFAEPEGLFDRLAGIGDSLVVENAGEYRVENLVQLVRRHRKRALAIEPVVEGDLGLASSLGDADVLGVVGVLLDRLVGEESLRPVDDGPRRRHEQQV